MSYDEHIKRRERDVSRFDTRERYKDEELQNDSFLEQEELQNIALFQERWYNASLVTL